MRVPPLFEDPEVLPLLKRLTVEHKTDATLLKDLCGLVIDNAGAGRADGIDGEIGDALDRCLILMGEK